MCAIMSADMLDAESLTDLQVLGTGAGGAQLFGDDDDIRNQTSAVSTDASCSRAFK